MLQLAKDFECHRFASMPSLLDDLLCSESFPGQEWAGGFHNLLLLTNTVNLQNKVQKKKA